MNWNYVLYIKDWSDPCTSFPYKNTPLLQVPRGNIKERACLMKRHLYAESPQGKNDNTTVDFTEAETSLTGKVKSLMKKQLC